MTTNDLTGRTFNYSNVVGYHSLTIGTLISIPGLGMGRVINWFGRIARRTLVVELVDVNQPTGATVHYEVSEDTDILVMVEVSA